MQSVTMPGRRPSFDIDDEFARPASEGQYPDHECREDAPDSGLEQRIRLEQLMESNSHGQREDRDVARGDGPLEFVTDGVVFETSVGRYRSLQRHPHPLPAVAR